MSRGGLARGTALGLWLIGAAEGIAQTVPPSASTNACRVLVIEGTVEVAPSGTTHWVAAHTNQILQVGDQLRTGPRSRVTIRLANLSVLRLDELTTVVPEPTAEDAVLLKRGTQYFFNRGRPGSFRFKTALTSGTIRGTEFVLSTEGSGQTTLSLIDGEVDLQAEGASLRVESGEQAVLASGQPPRKSPLLQAQNVIQWCLYYPAVLDPDELPWPGDPPAACQESLAAYRRGNLAKALACLPPDLPSTPNALSLYQAAVLLAVGRVDQAEPRLTSFLGADDPQRRRLAAGLNSMIATIRQPVPADTLSAPQTATEWLAQSYGEQARHRLPAALAAAQQAVRRSPQFGFAWARLAELEFGFGHIGAAQSALDQALSLSPENAQAIALRGYLLTARNQIRQAREAFEAAIAVDGSLANAWLGRGLCRIRQGQIAEGREDLQVAATLEPQRAVLRHYLGKAFNEEHQASLARREIERAQALDPNDPTGWLYRALLNQQENRLQEGIRDLEHSRELNDNRSLFRSRLLLDQDRAVRGANLAALYQETGLAEVGFNEAARAVSSDYANASAHLFLANSYDALRDPRQINLRYETPWLSELFLSQLLAPVGAGNLSQYVSQQEYSRLFERNRVGVSSLTDYRSNGDWHETASQFGTWDSVSYAVDLDYRHENGQRDNDDLAATTVYTKIKAQLTPQDSVFLMANTYDLDMGDVRQYYDPQEASATLRVTETQEPNFFVGYHRQWSPESHTLLLLGRLDDELTMTEPNASTLVVTRDPLNGITSATALPNSLFPAPFAWDYERQLEAYSVEGQQIWTPNRHTVIAGARFQTGGPEMSGSLNRNAQAPPPVFFRPPYTDSIEAELQRFNLYAYDSWRVFPDFQLQAGLSYEQLDYPLSLETLPAVDDQASQSQWSPKVGFLWTIRTNTHVRGAWTRWLGGAYYDASLRLEPVQVAGFTQAYRSIIPESAPGAVAGLIPGAEFETRGLALDHQFPTGTYVGIDGQWLQEKADRAVGVFNYRPGQNATPSYVIQDLEYDEQNLGLYLHQLLSRDFSLGVRYGFSHVQLEVRYPELHPQASAPVDRLTDEQADLHQITGYLDFHHPCGFFSRAESQWFQQTSHGYQPRLPGEDLWQINVFAGYRLRRRAAEIQVGILNLTDQDYRLNPLNGYPYLMRERTFTCRLRLNF